MSQENTSLVPSMGFASFTDEQITALEQPLPTSVIKERRGPGGRMLKYIAGQSAIAAANRIFGYGKWGYRVLSKSHEKCGESDYYTADIELYVLGCPFPFPGEGVGVVTSNNVEGHEKARKEAVTDALKRALRHFGDQFGLALYSEDSLVEDEQGNLVKVRDAHPTNGNAQPARRVVDATPQNGATTKKTRQEIIDTYTAGKKAGSWKSISEFYAAASALTGLTINEHSVNTLSDQALVELLAQDAA